ncbi:MAG: methyl-accepting chemotaxis protein, partial [Bacillota bacterium]|nr:methyl-accepting chemotaxis protein [Bacillota bacterium]
MKLKKINRRLSLRNKITGSFLILILFSSLVIGKFSYNKMRSNVESIVGNTALSIVKSIVNTIDYEKFDKLQTKDDMQSEYYKELQTHLSEVRKTTGLRYLYTIRKTKDGKYIYVVDGSSMDDKDFSSLGDEEKDISDIQLKSFQGITGYEFSTNKWGYLISAYVPIKDKSGNVVGSLGADFDANIMVSELNKYKTGIIIIIAAVILIGILIGELLSVILVRSINKLKAQAELVKEGDLTVKFDKIGNDEIGVLTQAFKDMVNNLLSITNEIKNRTQNVVCKIDELHVSFNEINKSTEEIIQVITEVSSGALEQTNNIDEV